MEEVVKVLKNIQQDIREHKGITIRDGSEASGVIKEREICLSIIQEYINKY